MSISEQDTGKKIMQKAGALLARRPRSRGELREKLSLHWEAALIESVLDRLEHLHLLNDSEYAYNFASRWMRQDGWGPAKVQHLLHQRKISAQIALAAVNRVLQETSDAEALEAYLDRRYRTRPQPEDRKGIHKLFTSLRRRGFSSETVYQVLRHRIAATAWQDFDTGD